MSMQALENTARAMVADGKGILAIDESTPTCGKRFASVGVENTEDNRRAYREMLLTAPGLSEYISGAILYDETLRMRTADGTPFPEVMKRLGIMPGIKVDAGAKDLAGHPGEKVTEGLDGLRERLREYRHLSAHFAKWRAVITIGAGIPSRGCIEANTHALARYAALCQEASLVPIVEPEVLMDGAHAIERCYEVSEETLRTLFTALRGQRVVLEGIILKASMVLSGSDCLHQAGIQEVAEHTLRCLRNTVPAAVPGIAFLSGGQNDELATAHLNAMNVIGAGKLPWPLSFSYARALQQAALKTWKGEASKVGAAQKVLHHRAKCNSAAALGRYSEVLEKELAA
jgi:Fructose-1,6-bisphosphate aldolase